ncbi:MAG: GldG family protein [Alphaproteobacteria bacterium]|nr:GldG family protein [Alphaproteobacteria bacterium]MBU2379162.1 GldG family protein [Alphaproteobacteria bacterium]
MRFVALGLACGVVVLSAGLASAQEQMGDVEYRPVVADPAFARAEGPRVVLDQGHGSEQTKEGRYRGFAALVTADGYRVGTTDRPFDDGGLEDVDVLVIANPAGASPEEGDPSAFTASEIEAISDWVEAGGALLFAADHAPHGTAAQALAARFGVGMGLGYAFRLTPDDREPTGLTTNLDYRFDAGTAGAHPILAGRPGERIGHVHTFTGQSLTPPPAAVVLLPMSTGYFESADRDILGRIRERLDDGNSAESALDGLATPVVAGAQGLAMSWGQGRLVVLGEAGFMTAQRIVFPPESGRKDLRFGLSTTDNDNPQFVLNMLHWLAGPLSPPSDQRQE